MDQQLLRALGLEGETPNEGRSPTGPGRSTLTARLTPAPKLVFRVADPETARALGESFGRGARSKIQRRAESADGARDSNGVMAGAEAAIDRAATSSGAPLPSHVQQRLEGSLGADLSSVRVHTGGESQAAAHAVGSKAYTVGNDIHFAAGKYQPDDPFGMHLLAHEVAHTVQQSGGAQRRQHKLEVSAPQEASEHEADRAAHAMVEGRPVTIGGDAAGIGRVQRFSEDNHRAASIDGLKGTFSAQEIGEIYTANWERDFSQSHPKIVNAVLAWTQVKNEALAGGPIAGGGAFQGAVQALLTTPPKELVDTATGTSMDGYKSWHHFDKPSDKKVLADADARWSGARNGLAGYICDTKAYIKDQLVAAVDFYREMAGSKRVGDRLKSNWEGGATPDGYVPTEITRDGNKVKSQIGDGFDAGVDSRDPIKAETERLARGSGAGDGALSRDGRWPIVAQHLGRAMHAFEDFWAHSNWVELAHTQAESPNEGTQAARNAELQTGIFDLPAKAHSLGHKIVALAEGFQAQQALLQRIYGRSGPSDRLQKSRTSGAGKAGQAVVKGALDQAFGGVLGPLSAWGAGKAMASDGDNVFDPLERKTGLGVDGFLESAGAIYTLVNTGRLSAEEIVCNPGLLAALASKGHEMIQFGDMAAGPGSHGTMAKDQDEHGKEHGLAKRLASTADAKVFGPLRKIMDERDPEVAAKAVESQLKLIDQMLQAPGPGHPLWGM